jgi:hypothetical protein
MDWDSFDDEVLALTLSGKAEEAERRLLSLYDESKKRSDTDMEAEVVPRLAFHYSNPVSEDLARAAAFFREWEELEKTDFSKLQTALFRLYTLRDMNGTLEKTCEIIEGNRVKPQDPNFWYAALALNGQALLLLGRNNEAELRLEELYRVLLSFPRDLTYGDAFGFLKLLIEKKICLERVGSILEVFSDAPLTDESMRKVRELREELLSRQIDPET